MAERKIYAYAAWEDFAQIGIFFVNQIRGKEAYSFEFAELFNVKRTAASDYLSFAVSTVKNRWKYYAGKYKISSAECRRMAAVFNAQTKNIL